MNDENNRILSFEEIIAADDCETKDVNVPEWGGSVRFKTMSGKDRDNYIQTVQSRLVGSGDNRRVRNYQGLPAILLSACLVKADGSKLMERKQVEDLQSKNGAIIDRLVKIAQEMNGLSDAEVVKQAKNSETTTKEDDGIESPES